ncbi:DNA alkylation repair protein [Cohnella sp. CFH 77786]|uniref:DNA alkylation repair protein n=1 Tax=Cohnella sp. CFH 77786 TaxID=2662265 RepID=UPI001C60C72B|nr:DNA alkylation repair protein [Cohnella sp. CFH 77786]MBW5444596.1 DNA alkylation repair protein [Cohnella sp. CFH 77786]
MTEYTDSFAEFLRAHRNDNEAVPMAAYMKNHFPFLGLKTPVRTALTREYWKSRGLPTREEFRTVVQELWALPEREFQYTAMAILDRMDKSLTANDIGLLEELILTRPWWDTVDLLAGHSVGRLFARHPELISAYTNKWMDSGELWLQRTALLFQLGYKSKTDAGLLFRLIEQCKESKEFFIRKAIGWALRELSKTDPDAVVSYVVEAGLSPLSEREALKFVHRTGNSG